ncbi:hypothetical protein BWQ96_10525 [Gracilariopsis chorda]|uniref:Uncharacterized protein n=1 Tax=Gracilariopsis chorda TaxID=448386 RepID=A0A2V3ICE4_9FLOR|nr:hypothetical protein BWQ96_10525 [Gracilariopsis chorda]|eukprot:PXF39765.1 hypothetical protein BWQ96_10525 [Gracilariopsis chorda]
MRSFWHRKQRSGTDAARKSMRSYLQIWNMNFMGLIMLGVRRTATAVFSGLQLPNEEEFQQLTFQAEQSSYIELRTGTEKRPRYIDLPFMILPVTTALGFKPSQVTRRLQLFFVISRD